MKRDKEPTSVLEHSAVEAVNRALRYQGVTRAELSRRMGLTPPFVSNVLNLTAKNMTMRTCARMLDALGYDAEVRLRPR